MKASVDQDLCIGCELCVDTCPEAFRMGDDNLSHPTREEFGEDLYGCIREAADVCPVTAISIEE
jgi:ferredoxin